jgi:archaetidylinositol phosphate synthase
LLTKLKQRAQQWFAAEAKLLHRLGLSPNNVSILGIIFAVLSAVVYWQWNIHPLFLALAPILMLFSGFLDALDGTMARLYGEATTFGGFFDSLLDRYADAIVLCGIVLGGLTELSWGLAALVGSMLVSYARARAEAAGVKMESVGLAERAERIVLLALASFLSFVWFDAIKWTVLVLAVLANLTVIQRALYFRKASQKEKVVSV